MRLKILQPVRQSIRTLHVLFYVLFATLGIKMEKNLYQNLRVSKASPPDLKGKEASFNI